MKAGIFSAYIIAILTLVFPTGCSYADEPQRHKKIIEYGWDVKDHQYIRKNIEIMERLPFDGIIFNLAGYKHGFYYGHKYNDAEFASIFEDLKNIKWQKFTDNFTFMHLSPTEMDWFSDEHWEVILNNIKILARVAKIGKCKGICIDPEGYGKPSPWVYDWNGQTPIHYDSKSYDEYARQVRKRGKQFIQEIQREFPRPKLLFFVMLTIYDNLLESANPDSDSLKTTLKKHRYALYYHFINGMLDGLEPETELIDGNEHAYYYTSRSEFEKAFVDVKQRYLFLIAPENRKKYTSQVKVAAAMYMDHIFGIHMHPGTSIGAYLTESNRLKLFEHNLFYGLNTSEEYVWCYSEKMNWWRGKVPTGSHEAIKSAKDKVRNSRKLGFSIEEEIARAKSKQLEVMNKPIRPLSTIVKKVKKGTPPPVIDGILNDKAWNDAKQLGPFVPLRVGLKDNTEFQTNTKIIWDDNNLYVCFDCCEPELENLHSRGTKKDDNIWAGDCVELFICESSEPKPFFHFIVNPENVQWDAITDTASNDTSWNADWKSDVKKNKTFWTVEMAIPWTQISGTPSKGEIRKGNFTRYRRSNREWTTWTPLKDSFGDSENFANWKFVE